MRAQSLLFMGSPDFALIILQQLVTHLPNHRFSIITQPDSPSGRGKKTTPTPVKEWARPHSLSVHTPHTKPELEQIVFDIQPNLIIVASYGMIIPKSVTDTFFCLNVHPSLLPLYRGATPIQSALLNNDPKTGVTIIKINEKMDAGEIICQSELPIYEQTTFLDLHDKTAQIGAELLLPIIQANKFKALPLLKQNDALAVYCTKIDKTLLRLTTDLSPQDCLNRIRAFSPKPGAFVEIDNKRIKLLSATLSDQKLIINTCQPEGKKAMSYSDYLLGNPNGISLC